MVSSMKQTIDAQNARIATLEKQQAPQAPAPAKKAARDRSDEKSVASAPVEMPIAESPAPALPAERCAVRDADTFADLQQAAPRANNVPLDPELKGFIPIPGTDTRIKSVARPASIRSWTLTTTGIRTSSCPRRFPWRASPDGMAGSAARCTRKAPASASKCAAGVSDDDTLRIYTEYDFFDDSTSSSMKFRAGIFTARLGISSSARRSPRSWTSTHFPTWSIIRA
jgi:hypothetical protein